MPYLYMLVDQLDKVKEWTGLINGQMNLYLVDKLLYSCD